MMLLLWKAVLALNQMSPNSSTFDSSVPEGLVGHPDVSVPDSRRPEVEPVLQVEPVKMHSRAKCAAVSQVFTCFDATSFLEQPMGTRSLKFPLKPLQFQES